jgi:hypothetical protein
MVRRQLGKGDKNKIPASIAVPYWGECVHSIQHYSDRLDSLRTAVSLRRSAA